MRDIGRKETDKLLDIIERKLKKLYSTASNELNKKAKAFFLQFQEQDKKLKEQFKNGEITKTEYNNKRRELIMQGEAYKKLQKDITKKLAIVNVIALAYINGKTPKAFSTNYNYIEKIVEKETDVSFDTITEESAKELIESKNKDLKPLQKELDVKKDVNWNTKKVNSQVLQGIILGEAVEQMPKRIKKVVKENRNSAIRNAVTILVAAESLGRLFSMFEAKEHKVIIKKTWNAVGDARTRDWHAELNGITIDLDENFVNDYGEIAYPGDSSAAPANYYNCRCSLDTTIVGVEK